MAGPISLTESRVAGAFFWVEALVRRDSCCYSSASAIRQKKGESTQAIFEDEMQFLLVVSAVLLSLGTALVTAAGVLSLIVHLMSKIR
jgi:hypothetical protein